MHAELPVVRLDLSDRLRTLIIETVRTVRFPLDNGMRQKRFEDLLYRDGAGAGSAAAMWRGKSFVQIDVKNVDAEISRACNPHHRIEVRAIHVHKSAV